MENAPPLNPDACWYNAPRERTPQFFSTYSHISMALQEALRILAPRLFFADVRRFEDPQIAWPLLTYAASPIYRPRVRTEFSWDVLHASSMRSFYRLAQRNLPAHLEPVSIRLAAEGRTDLLPNYLEDQAAKIIDTVQTHRRHRKLLQRPVVSEGRLLNELMRFSNLALAKPRVRARGNAEFAKNWRAILGRFYGPQDFSVLGPVLLDVATRALLQAGMAVETETVWEQLAA